MVTVSATKLRNNLFDYLARVAQGETIAVQRNGKDVAVVVPAGKGDWRDKMRTRVKLLVPADEAFAPLDDMWEDYH